MSPFQGLLWSGGLGPCESIMGWVQLGDVKCTHVHLWSAYLARTGLKSQFASKSCINV